MKKIFCGLCLSLAFSSLTLAVDPPSAPPNFEEDAKRVFVFKLQGNGANDPRCQQGWAAIEKSNAQTLKNIYDICGLALPQDKKVNVYFKDVVGKAKPGSIVYGVTYPADYGSYMDYSLPTVVGRNQNPLHIYQHEMTHALQESIMGNNAYWNPNLLHDWIREGLATYVGGHGPERLVRFKSMGARMITGLESHVGPSDYAEDYLAFVFIESKWGKNGVKSFVRDCTYNRVPWKQAIKNLTGMDWSQFTVACREFSIAYIGAAPTQVAQNPPQPAAPTPPKPSAQTPKPATTAPLPPKNPPVAQRPRQTPPAVPLQPFLGAMLQNPDEETSRIFNLAPGEGVLIIAVRTNSPADKAGLQAGDVMLEFDGKPAKGAAVVEYMISSLKPGDKIETHISRDGQPMTFNITIGGQTQN